MIGNFIRVKALNISCLLFVVTTCLCLFECQKGYAITTYIGRDAKSQWRQLAMDRIEKIRKGNLTIEIVDHNSKPVSSANVKIVMQRHEFAFGSAVTARELTSRTPDGNQYRKIVENSFNKVVLENDLKWGQWENSLNKNPNGQYNIDNTLTALDWLRAHNIMVRGHYVAWGPIAGDYGTTTHAKNDANYFRKILINHAEEEVHRVGNLVAEWDVVNHPIGWGPRTIRDIAGSDIYNVMFSKMRSWNPLAMRYINEGSILPGNGSNQTNFKYFQLIDEMLKQGVPIQGIGFMGHFFAERDLTPPQNLLKILDKYSSFGLPLQITEFDVRFGTPNKWGEVIKLTPEQEQLQADYTRDFLITMFSHPSVVGVVMWGFWEGSDWYPSAALYRQDWSIKPNGKIWEDLVFNKWWTNVTGTSDNNGKFSTRGFLGIYNIEVLYNGHKYVVTNVILKRSGTIKRIILK